MITTVVRGFGYDVTHVITVPETSAATYSVFGSVFTGFRTPLMAHCGKQVRSIHDVVVVMAPGTKVKCVQCRRFSGVEVQPDEKETLDAD